ncbi:MAG: bifunctional phosphoribosyl-AMP cyclohydrolase/phosphoribosyl-ATP diphosphatase HisIE [Candidatus Brocadiae bacterium]|nr:bifunctional phosphoribosyl-AMP cyclohydrolase/phosphoribosyl-ATP diphosphatase HisIE [Candidatus Brocadiia bacterium]
MTSRKLIPVVVQDVRTNCVLMLGYADAAALRATKKTGLLHFWSRSRNALWKKGETSGNTLRVVELRRDCDRDAILARVEPAGPTCHTGGYSCFSKSPIPARDVLRELMGVFRERKRNPSPDSYVNRLLADPEKALKKVGEEAVEFVLAAKGGPRGRAVSEAADLVFHLLLAMFRRGIALEDLEAELGRRRGVGGLEEKRRRKP